MIVFIVMQMEIHEGGCIEKVFNTKCKAENYVKKHPLNCSADYYEIEEKVVE